MELLENISTNTKPKDSCYIVCRGNSSSIQTTFSPALEGRGYEIAVVGLSTYYSYPNITEKNNRIDILKISKGGTDVVMYEVALDIGCYEIKDINEGIKKKMEWKKKEDVFVTITEDPITLKSYLNILEDHDGGRWQVVFPKERSLGKVLGFKSGSGYYGPKKYISDKIANILSVNNILVQCDIISGSSINGKPAPVIFNTSPNVMIGHKIVAEPVIPIYLPVTVDRIHEVNVWVTDQDNDLLNLQGEDLIVTFHMRER